MAVRRARVAALIVDSSALLAFILGEAEGDGFASTILLDDTPAMSAASYVECAMVLDGQMSSGFDPRLDAAVSHLGIAIVPLTEQQARLARRAFELFGKGRHPAALNFGDCLTYALAKESNQQLLYKGNDFLKTDLG